MGELRRLEARLTEEQMNMLDRLALDTGLTKTDVIRALITHASVADELDITGDTVIVLDRASASKIAYQLRKVGINLNQATAALNTIARAAQKATDDPLQVLDLVEAIESVKYLLIGYEVTRRSARNLMEGLTGSRGVFLDRLDRQVGASEDERQPFELVRGARQREQHGRTARSGSRHRRLPWR